MGISCGSHRIWVRNNLVAAPFRNGAIYLSRMGWCATSTRPWNADRTKAIRTGQLWVRLGDAITTSAEFKNAHIAAVVPYHQASQQTVGFQAPPPRVSLS